MNEHPFTPEDVAVYALGASPNVPLAECVRTHLETCAECRAEYNALRPVVDAIGYSAEARSVSPALKERIMREVRSSTLPRTKTTPLPAPAPTVVPARSTRAIVWPAYLVAAACFAIALFSTIQSISLTSQLKSAQTQVATLTTRAQDVERENANQRTMLADLNSGDAKHFGTANNQVVARGDHLYILLRDLPALPKGRVYQAWTQEKGAKAMSPSITFEPDTRGVAVIALPESALKTAVVAVSVEPEGGSKEPTTKPIAVVPLS